MTTVTLIGRSHKGFKAIRDFGNVWQVWAGPVEKILFNPGSGPWLRIAPLNQPHDHEEACWVHSLSDPDFVVKVNPTT